MSMEARKAIGYRISFARRVQEMTQKDFAKAVGACKSTVGYWEAGEHDIPVWRIPDICRVLKISPQELVGTTSRLPATRQGMGSGEMSKNARKNTIPVEAGPRGKRYLVWGSNGKRSFRWESELRAEGKL